MKNNKIIKVKFKKKLCSKTRTLILFQAAEIVEKKNKLKQKWKLKPNKTKKGNLSQPRKKRKRKEELR